jgi:hypothetical protein
LHKKPKAAVRAGAFMRTGPREEEEEEEERGFINLSSVHAALKCRKLSVSDGYWGIYLPP